MSLGKGRNWVYLGPSGAGASTGVGPLRFYDWYGGSRARQPSLAQYERQRRTAQQLEELQGLASRIQHMLSLHRQEFPAAEPPLAPPG